MQIKLPTISKHLAIYSMISLLIIYGLYATFHLSHVEELGARIARDQLLYNQAATQLNEAQNDAEEARAELESLFPASR